MKLTVERVEGGTLRVREGGYAGTVGRDEVVAFDRAAAEFSRQIPAQPGSAWPRWMRGRVRSTLKDLDGALADLDEAVRLEPANPFSDGPARTPATPRPTSTSSSSSN